MNSDTLMISKLSSGRQVMIVPDDRNMCFYRYLGDKEVEGGGFRTYGVFDWIQTPVRSTKDNLLNDVKFIEIDGDYISLIIDTQCNDDLYKVHNLGRFV